MTGLRERQKAGRRKDILAAASLLFRRDGFAETSIEQIAGRARLSAGTVYNYPIRPWHNAKPSLTAFEAAPDEAVQVYNRAIHNQMMARIKEGQSIKQVIAWAKDELEGFAR